MSDFRRISVFDQWILNPTTGKVVGIQLTDSIVSTDIPEGVPPFLIVSPQNGQTLAYNALGFWQNSFDLRTGFVASAVNYWQLNGATAGNAINAVAEGSDTNIGIGYSAKGTGFHSFYTNGAFSTQQFGVTHTANAVNYINVTGGVTSGSPVISAVGSDTNIGFNLWTKGTGAFNFATGGSSAARQFSITHTASAVNYWQITGSTTANAISASAIGSDTNISMLMASKGTGSVFLQTSGSVNQLVVAHTASAVNYWQMTGAPAGSRPSATVAGSDTNIGMIFQTKGTGVYTFATGASNNEQMRINHIASAVNYLAMAGAVTTAIPGMYAEGSDANVSVGVRTKGGGGFFIYADGGGTVQFAVSRTASAVNYLQASGAATGSGAALACVGTDTNIDLVLTPKGTGAVNINGTAAATSTATCNRTVPVKVNGTTLYLMLSTTA